MEHSLRFSVVICVYTEERWDDIVAAVASVREQTVAAAEIVVVVDHNVALQRRVEGEIAGVRVVANGGGQGLSGGRNSGVAASVAPLVAFLDDDATAAPDWLAQLAPCFDDPRVVGVGGAIEPQWPDKRPRWFPPEFDWVVGCTYAGVATGSVRNLIGTNMAIRRSLFAEVGGFREGIGRIGSVPLGDEETELCIRVRQQYPGAIWFYHPEARVSHRVTDGRTRWQYFVNRCYHEGLSKACMVGIVGADDGLAAERTYTFQTLPNAVWRGIAEGCMDGDLFGFVRADTIVAGLVITAFGYLVGAFCGRWVRRVPRPEVEVVALLET